MGISQPHAAKIEHQEDMHLSTLRRYLESLGGELKLVACLAGKQQEITLHEHQGQHDSP
jgi:hypothetical protein